MLFALLGRRTRQFDDLGHFETDLFLDDFEQRDICRAEIADFRNQWPAHRSRARIELANTA